MRIFSKYSYVFFFVLFFFLKVPPAFAQTLNTWSVTSPNSNVKAEISYASPGSPYPAEYRLYYRLLYKNNEVIPLSPLGIQLTEAGCITNLTFQNQTTTIIDETFTVKSGKKSQIRNNANELNLNFTTAQSSTCKIVVRAYDDAIAFRYQLSGSGTGHVTSEITGFRLSVNAELWAETYTSNYENQYTKRTMSSLAGARLGFPLLSKINNYWILLAEAGVDGNYVVSQLATTRAGSSILDMAWPSDQTTTVDSLFPVITPWRVIVVGETLEPLVETTVFQELSPPASDTDTWVKPGRVAWSWWSDANSPKTLQPQKDYVDFASEMGWEYIVVDEGWDSWPSGQIQELVSYANSKNVGIILWYFYGGKFSRWTPQGWEPDIGAALTTFEQLEKWGVKGVKIDFFDSDSQKTMKMYDTIMQAAVNSSPSDPKIQWKMVVNFHGSSIPTGLSRKYPWWLTQEGVYGAEHKSPPSSHTTMLPFTRNILGSMDYTPVTFSITGGTTYTHQLAESVVFESGLQHFADSKESYRTQSTGVKDFLKQVPVAWDDTKFLNGAPGDFIVLARRKGNDWYIGAMNATTARNVTIPLSFTAGTYQATLYKDGTTATDIVISNQQLTSSNSISLTLPANGGSVVYLKQLSQTNTPTPTPKPGDVNGDNSINLSDLVILLSNFGKTNQQRINGDVNGDGNVNLTDLSTLLANFGN